MTKQVKEIYTDLRGKTTVEYYDDSIRIIDIVKTPQIRYAEDGVTAIGLDMGEGQSDPIAQINERVDDNFGKSLNLDPTAGLQIGGAAPNAEQRAAVRAGIGAAKDEPELMAGAVAAAAYPPDYQIDFTQIITLPAGITCTAPNLSSRGIYIGSQDESPTMALATLVPSLTSAAWSVEIEYDVDAFALVGQNIFEFGGGVNNRFTFGTSAPEPGNSPSWSNLSTSPSLDVKTGGAAQSSIPHKGTITVSNSGTSARIVVNNTRELFNLSSLQAVGGTLNLNLGATKSLSESHLLGYIKSVKIWASAIPDARLFARSIPYENLVVFFGDSLTVGAGSSPNSYNFPNQFTALSGVGAMNYGVAGENSTQIRDVFFSADALRNRRAKTIIWSGRNGFVLSDITKMTDRLGHDEFRVLSIINRSDGTEDAGSAAYNTIIANNAALAAQYGEKYLDVRSMIVSRSGGANDAPDPSATVDGLHLTSTAYGWVAEMVAASFD